jgi:hypothetical protein
MANQDSGYALKNENDTYYCGLNMFDKQLRKVKIYHSLRYAKEAIENIKERNPEHRDDVWRIIKVEIREI